MIIFKFFLTAKYNFLIFFSSFKQELLLIFLFSLIKFIIFFVVLLAIYIIYNENIIVGSGPASVSAASELLINNKKVLILDVGNEIEDEKAEIVKEYIENPDIAKFKNKVDLAKKKIKKYPDPNLKFPYGSDFVFRVLKDENIEHSSKVNTLSSHAKGGL